MVCGWEGADSDVAIIYGQVAEPQASSLPRSLPGAPTCVNEPLSTSPPTSFVVGELVVGVLSAPPI